MVDTPVVFPAPRADDDEDVVWGLSTASTLWARGEKQDAIVWVRRASEAAAAAGQDPRADELLRFAADLEPLAATPAPASDRLRTGRVPEVDEASISRRPTNAVVEPALAGASLLPPGRSPRPPDPNETSPGRRSVQPRIPILDPWSDDAAATSLKAPLAPSEADDTIHVAVRPGSLADADDDVVTSALPLDQALGGARTAKSLARARPRGLSGQPLLPPPPTSRPSRPSAGASPTQPPHSPPPSAPGSSDKPSELGAAGSPGAAAPPRRPPPPPPPARTNAAAREPPRVAPVFTPPPFPRTPPPNGAGPVSRDTVPFEDRPVERRRSPAPHPGVSIGAVPMDSVHVLADLPHEVQLALAESARIEQLAPDEEVAGFGTALVLEGEGLVCATIIDAPVRRAARGVVVHARGALDEGIALRVAAGASGARVAVWSAGVVDDALRSCPWAHEELRTDADRLQALAGATMGPLGELDEDTRARVAEKLTVRLVRPGEAVAKKGAPLTGLVLVGAGAIAIGPDARKLQPGDALFPEAASTGAPAPDDAEVLAPGALLLVAEGDKASEVLALAPALRGPPTS